ncbi:ferritin-like protein [Spongiactinospora sp. TRM90649]|uniref:ferritin-like domain-containing protein n=1 Tax=Spongiactinospora sp. TRM90649 TaxID=3031114 RepID=UPI0023F80327|nr:ferritin-like protein [Spongiactinospora sp. TRM90649]MDF5756957.1 ferritin-like protein [Spongiactinospora sp. TRM90649]
MTTPRELRDINWIRGALQAAVALEHSTMPLYSAAMYSLEVQNYPSYNTIRSVLMEEMLHMAAVCNMLAALGGSPRIRGLDPGFPSTGLPGNVAPDLRAVLARLSQRQLDNFMRIEAQPALLTRDQRAATYPTIGEFYQAIKDAITGNAAAVRRAVRDGGPANQVGGNLGYQTIQPGSREDPVERLLKIIEMITDQGEGESAASIEAGAEFQNEGSHYARFAELRYGRRYLAPAAPPAELSRDTVAAYFRGDDIAWPVVINTLAVPADGYAAILALDPDASSVRKELEAFDSAYTAMMVALDHAWNGPERTSWPSLGEAVIQMNEMRVLSCFNIMRHRVPADVVARLPELYPAEHRTLAAYTDLKSPVFYGPRFVNNAAGGR